MGATHLAACSTLPGVTVSAISTRNPRALAGDLSHIGGNLKRETPIPDFSGAVRYPDWRDLLLDRRVDAVDICLPTELHEAVTLAALSAGKHVLCEKPMALTASACDAMLEAAGQQNRILMIGHVLRFWPAYVFLQNFVRGQPRGPIREATFTRQCGIPDWSNWLPDESRSGGAVLDLLIHDIDQALALFGTPEAVRAESMGPEDTLRAKLLYGNGPDVRIEGGWFGAGMPFSMGFQVRASEATLEYSSSGLLLSDDRGRREEISAGDEDAYAGQLSYFAGCCARDRQPERCPPQQSATAVKLALMLRESRNRKGDFVACDL